ncbi:MULTISPECIES: hypothetical protein [unclassified Pseudomonas]|uniref:hypothetical protein n=1 Tax=unclassified Pseudomonas TaxID=196821 RepID=UPI00087142D7|nr:MULTISPECIES: hypothetical protein [unclassified Pseudomonas]SCW29154.1 hypothetical protein SAMN03159481_00182 [Pseudomonas sp. NFACC56-3]SFK10943.1 hypothetical protein SAMN03159473_00182 [Pseudomonas sp. NFACC52]
MSNLHSPGRSDLAHARHVEVALIDYLRAQSARHEALVIAAVGELRIRIDAADALLEYADESQSAAIAFRLAAAEAVRLAGDVYFELAGRSLPRPLPHSAEPVLPTQRRLLGDHYLNGAALADEQEGRLAAG